MGVVMGRNEKVNIPHMYIKLVMDLDKLRKFHWGLHSYDFLLSSIDKARKRLGKKDSYIFEGFSYAIQIWLMEAIPDFGEICGKRVSDSFRGPMCGNWKGVAKVSYQDITKLEDSFTDKSVLFSVISVRGNDVLIDQIYRRKGEMEDERVDLILERIRTKFDWSNTDWEVIEAEDTVMEEAVRDYIDAEAANIGEDTDVVADEETSSVEVTGKGKRKVHDEGAETRKNTSVTSLGEMLSAKMENMEAKMENMESMFTERMGKMESMVSQLRSAIRLSAEGSDPSMSEAEEDVVKNKGDQAASKKTAAEAPSKSKGAQAPSKSKGAQAASKTKDNQSPPKSKGGRAPPKSKDTQAAPKKAGEKIALETNDFDFGLNTQDLGDLPQSTFVDGFDLSQVKVEKSSQARALGKSIPHLVDETRGTAAETAPDAALVFLGEEDWAKVTKWSTSPTPIRCGPTILDTDVVNRLMDPFEWLNNWEIDAAMFVFRERTSLNRWKPFRVAFMTTVFRNMIKKEYSLLKGGRRKYNLHNLLVEYGKGVLPPRGATHEIWNVDVDRMYVPVHVSGNHWIALCISFATRSIDVFDCSDRKHYTEVEAFAIMIPRIVKAVQPANHQKDFLIGAYTVEYVKMGSLNKSACDCGVYAVKFIECHALGLELSLLNDDNIKEARHRQLWDLWEAANDQELVEKMSKYEPPACLSSTYQEIL
ncbi:uncharacterized protein LOC108839470 [Raphanus sativus]|uniref:Uncharacterized protein LOC108839470 n=1 Tax=Raphanus sativus TaxID=3726 RepID=A0A6J0M6Y4_RAPSA|nr:uncharacterized protein LOC108839470 [Raphanus sativus]